MHNNQKPKFSKQFFCAPTTQINKDFFLFRVNSPFVFPQRLQAEWPCALSTCKFQGFVLHPKKCISASRNTNATFTSTQTTRKLHTPPFCLFFILSSCTSPGS
ncbi:hypothetical protein CEXT_68701 [Caerostris extrusa]|uniref:Uncharacterized protein n=1 Tax=Caerostris extrusa TaxID=172846 RepID=A0AAV4T1R0_CAEEX|nr:hypothetical protein CEXT_68701 [Caerostris extrusa]